MVVCVAFLFVIEVWSHVLAGTMYDPWMNVWTVNSQGKTLLLALIASGLAALTMIKKEYRKAGLIIICVAIVAVVSHSIGLSMVEIVPDG